MKRKRRGANEPVFSSRSAAFFPVSPARACWRLRAASIGRLECCKRDFISGAIDSPHARRTNGERLIVDANAKANDDQVMTDGGGATTNSFFSGACTA